jgi:hypothetical protein
MKKRIFTSIFVSLLFVAFAALGAFAADSIGHVLAVKEDAVRDRGGNVEDAKEQMELSSQDNISTKERSRIKLYFSDESILNIGESSDLTIDQYNYKSDAAGAQTILSMATGSLKAVTGKSELIVKTSSAIATARDSDFIIWSNTSQQCVMCLRGKVNLTLGSKSTDVPEGAVGCVENGNLGSAAYADNNLRTSWIEAFPTFASNIPFEPPAFAPLPVGIQALPLIPQCVSCPPLTTPTDVEVIFEMPIREIPNGTAN